MNFNKLLKNQLIDLAIRRFLYNDTLPPLNSPDYQSLVANITKDNNKDDLIKKLEGNDVRGFQVVPNELRKYPNSIIIKPTHGSQYSCGHDIHLPVSLSLPRNQSTMIMSDIACYMQNDEYAKVVVRSSTGIKLDVVLSNQEGIIDSDYILAKNGGNLGIALRNLSDGSKNFKAGDRIVQIIFQKYLIADNYNTTQIRSGGFGHSGQN